MRSRLAWLPPALLLTAVAEVAAFIAVAQAVGAGWAVLAGAVLSLLGVVLLRREGMRAWRRFRAAADSGRPPGAQVSDGVIGLGGALLLAVPGFVTALAGLLLLLPPLRALARHRVQALAERRMTTVAAGTVFGPRKVRVRRGDPVDDPAPTPPPSGPPAAPGAAIEGEIVDTGPRP
ncbi:FxsA family protein [Spirilliplanes yamanashiensis]|uniref:Uncharacterized protein n=1 Tax=Spirilliplanes yamanashiensis TaxID=42233 RepID=A0A8J3Y9V7_9ACTN|nr:FxsA family protein [Spirilliplanes yamanashiensis]MDP9817891.1 UPF0716 protein FxsA [Spirilliplanes yamanashiensis]GIJ04701.1 hypothetical protein Sya03_40530 [Spirilliplanes yamanashiensis]